MSFFYFNNHYSHSAYGDYGEGPHPRVETQQGNLFNYWADPAPTYRNPPVTIRKLHKEITELGGATWLRCLNNLRLRVLPLHLNCHGPPHHLRLQNLGEHLHGSIVICWERYSFDGNALLRYNGRLSGLSKLNIGTCIHWLIMSSSTKARVRRVPSQNQSLNYHAV